LLRLLPINVFDVHLREHSAENKNEPSVDFGQLFIGAPWSGLMFFVAHLFHPVDSLAVNLFQDRDVRHGCGRGPREKERAFLNPM